MVPIITASKRKPRRPCGSRIVIQKLRVVRYHICRKRETLRDRTGDVDVAVTGRESSVSGAAGSVLKAWIRVVTRAEDSRSASSVRVSMVEISMRWSAGLTCSGHGYPNGSKCERTSVTGPV
jgi:hypothetical protein